jgi:hypothetical protein
LVLGGLTYCFASPSLPLLEAANFFISSEWGSRVAFYSPSSANGFSIILLGLFTNLGDFGTV